MQNDDESLLEKIREGDVLVVNLAPERLTPELSMQCVRINGSNLRFIPRAVRTPAFDRAAALCSAWAFGYLDEADKTEELLLAVLASDDADTDPAMLGERWAVPDAILTPAVVAAAEAALGEVKVRKWLATRS